MIITSAIAMMFTGMIPVIIGKIKKRSAAQIPAVIGAAITAMMTHFIIQETALTGAVQLTLVLTTHIRKSKKLMIVPIAHVHAATITNQKLISAVMGKIMTATD